MSKKASLFRISASNLDVAEIERVIDQSIAQRRQYAADRSIDFEALTRPIPLNEQMTRLNLELMHVYKANIRVKPFQIPTSQPLWRRMFYWLKQQAHNLVIYYVNMLGQKQISFNESVAQAIAGDHAHIEMLTQKIVQLEAKIQKLEAQLVGNELKRHDE